MKRLVNISILVAVCIIITLVGCKKYEDGPGLSLRSKKSRISADWEFKKVIYNSVDETSDYIGSSWEIKKDGGFKLVLDGYIESGTWEFATDKEAIDFDQFGDIMRWNIKRLTSKELWIENIDNGDTTYCELSAK